MLKSLKIGITGATGALGGQLVNLFLENGYDVVVFVRDRNKFEKFSSKKIQIICGDLNNIEKLEKFIQGLDICVHIAAQVGNASKKRFYEVNIDGTKKICQSILNKNSQCRFIYCSSIVTLRVKWYNKFLFTDYTLSKYYAEKLVKKYEKRGLKTTIINPGFIFGPHDNNVIPNIIIMLKGGLNYFLKGGEKNIPLVYIDDLCDLFYKAVLEKKAISRQYYGVQKYQLGVHDLFKMVAKKLGYSYPTKIYPKLPFMALAILNEFFYKIFHLKSYPSINKRFVDVLSLNFDKYNDLAQNELNWTHKTEIEEGINQSLNWLKNK